MALGHKTVLEVPVHERSLRFAPFNWHALLYTVKIVQVPYNAEWAARFAAEHNRLGSLLGERVLKIEHIGSTAVPGLQAKAIIDMLIGVRTEPEIDLLIDAMEHARYTY